MKAFFLSIIAILIFGVGIHFLFFRTTEHAPQDASEPFQKTPTQNIFTEETTATKNTATPPIVDIPAQQRKDEVEISSIDTSEALWAVIYANDGGKPGSIVSEVLIPAGIHENIALEPPTDEDKIYIALHTDGGATGVFEFPGSDVALAMDGLVFVYPVVLK